MESFLGEVAADLYARYGEELSQRAVLFPSRRARLFFTDALARIARRPMWQPSWTTIDELMSEISGLRTGDRLRLITELYGIYSEYHAEPFDKFYFWGDMLLADFDTIDKYRIDAAMLFRNIEEIREIEADISYLTPAQLRIVAFWSSLGAEADLSEEKRRFLAIWRTLGPVYRRFRERLSELGIAYGGMVQRAAADRLRSGEFAFATPRRFVVAGFNALSECEKELFRFLSSAAETDFYWDYDSYYKDDPEQEAGMFVRENVVRFPPRAELSHDGMSRPKELTSVAAVSNAVQCKYVATILRGLAAGGRLGKETAVVLTDENLLLPLLCAMPPEVGPVNVTMGYPLRASLAYTFVERLVELQARRRTKGADCTFYHADVTGLLAHPYVAGCDAELTRRLQEEIMRERRISVEASWLGRNDLLRLVFSPAAGWRALSAWLSEVVAAVVRIPCLDDDARRRTEFLAVIAGEIARLGNSLDECGIEPAPEVYASLLRRHLQTLRIPYEGEPSRYIYQLGYESGFPLRRIEVGVDVNLAETAPIEVRKDDGVMRRLERFTDPGSKATLSPTAFFRYVACPLRFYFHSVARLDAGDEISEEVDAPMFGTILHAAVQRLYAPIEGEAHPGGTLRALIRTGEVAAAVEAAIGEHYLKDPKATAADYTGNLVLVKDIVVRYLRGGVMPYDAAHDGFRVEGLERRVDYGFDFATAGEPRRMKFSGIADRIDRLDDGSLRVVDYKTGSPHLEFAGIGSLFRGEGRQRLSNIVQTLLYAMMLYRSEGSDATPALYYVRAMNRPDYSPLLDDRELSLRGARYSLYAERFEELVRETLAEMYDPAVPFRQCADADTCRYCDFNVICKRG